MTTFVVTHDGSRFEVREGDESGRVVATFSNSLAAETFAEKQRMIDESAATPPTKNSQAS